MSDVRRCAKCDRVVYQDDEHLYYRCQDWPEWVKGVKSYLYRDYEVSPGYFGWQYVHKDYDGPEDHRCGTGLKDPMECFAEIDDHLDN